MSTKFNFENHPGYEKLKEAFRLSNKDFLGSIELVPEENVCFSLGYKRKMAQLIKRQKRPYWKYVNTVGKKIAAFALVFMMLFGLSMSIEAVREPVVRFVVSVFDRFSELFVDKSETIIAPDKIEEVFTITGLPSEFKETFFDLTKTHVETEWSDGKKKISLYQSIMNSKITFDTETPNITKICIDGVEIYYMYKNNKTQIFWRDSSYIFIIEYTDFVSEENVIGLYESLSIKKENLP